MPAIAAVAEREMRVRPSDIYIAGMWKSSLLEDLAWYTRPAFLGERTHACSAASVPTWSWASSTTPVMWYGTMWYEDVELLPTPQLIDVAFNPIGPVHLGKVKEASICVRGQVFAATLVAQNSLERPRCEIIDYLPSLSPYIERLEIDHSPDFDYRTGKWPIGREDSFTVMLLTASHLRSPERGGILLRKVIHTVYERNGHVAVRHITLPQDSPSHQVTRMCDDVLDDFVKSLPIREITIV